MNSTLIKTIFFIAAISINSADADETAKTKNSLRMLSVRQAIQLGLENSYEAIKFKIEGELAELNHKRALLDLFTPSVSLSADYGFGHTVTQMKYSDSESNTFIDPDPTQKVMMEPSGSISLDVSDLTLFSTGAISDSYKQEMDSYAATTRGFKETYLTYVFNVVSLYFSLVTFNEQVKNAENQVLLNQSIYDLSLQKTKSKKGTEADMLFAKGELIKAQQNLASAKQDYKGELLNFNEKVAQELSQDYNLVSKLNYRPINFSEDGLLKIFDKTPTMKTYIEGFRSAKIANKQTWKSMMPLPSLSLSGFSISHSLNDKYETIGPTSGNGNIDMTMSLNLSIPISSSGGFFNRIAIREEELNFAAAKLEFSFAESSVKKDLLEKYQAIKSIEEEVNSIKEQLENTSNLLDRTLMNYSKDSSTRDDILDAVKEVTEINKEYYTQTQEHLQAKIDLAIYLGKKTLFQEKLY